MSNLTRWEPMNEMMSLREAMDRLFDDAFTRPLSSNLSSSFPAIDLYQTDDDIVVNAVVPGFKPEDVQISVNANTLTLRGEMKQDEEHKDATYHIHELRQGSFERQIMLPIDVDSNKAHAEFENGVLKVTLPKAEAVKPKTITIKAK